MIKKSDKFFNTTNEDKEHVKKRVKVCESQEERVLDIFRKKKKHLTASQVWEIYGGMITPLTSIRRAMTRLKIAGIIKKTRLKRDGLYNKPEYYYKLTPKKEKA